MTRMDPREELRVLGEAIDKKKQEISSLEDIVIKASGVEADEEREKIKAKIEEYDKVLRPYSKFLRSVGVTETNRMQATQAHLKNLWDTSQKLKEEKEQLTARLAEMRVKAENWQTELRRGRRRELRKLKAEKEKLVALRDRLSEYKDSIIAANMWPELASYVNSLKKDPTNLHPDPLTSLNSRVSSILNGKCAQRKVLQERIEELRESCRSIEQRQEEIEKSSVAASKAYAESMEKKAEAEKRVAEAKSGIDAICEVITEKSKLGRDFSCRIEGADVGKFDPMTSFNLRLDKIRERMAGFENPLDKIVIEEVPTAVSGTYSFKKPEELDKYASVRKTVLSKVDPAEFKLFTCSESNLLKWYRINLNTYANTKARYERERPQAETMMSAAQVRYKKIVQMSISKGLKPLTEADLPPLSK